jgi:hypothetical protein
LKSVRKIKLSVLKQLTDLFGSGTLMDVEYNVYGEADKTSTLERPYVFLLDFGVPFSIQHLPFVVIQTVVSVMPFQMGSDAFFCDLALHVFGRSRAERDDISSAIMETIQHIQIVDFDKVALPVVGTVSINDETTGATWTNVTQALPFAEQVEASLANWNSLTTQFWVLSTNSL